MVYAADAPPGVPLISQGQLLGATRNVVARILFGSRRGIRTVSILRTGRLPVPVYSQTLVAALLLLNLGCRPAASVSPPSEPVGPAWFRDVTDEVGLNFVHDPGPAGDYFFPQIQGSGAALFDFDKDGRLDIYLLQNGGPKSRSTNRLFRQGADGRFTDVTAGSGLDVSGYGMGVAIGDVNNDGWPDVFITEYGRVRLFLNNRNGTFTDVTSEAGLDSPLWATAACFFDYDRDGWLDLVVVNYVDYASARPCADSAGTRDFCGPSAFAGTVAKLYHNLGRSSGGRDRVRFEDVTLRSGLAQHPGPGLGVVCADFDGDGWLDIFIANDAQANRLWINQHDGTFREEAVVRGIAYNSLGMAEANMGIALGDIAGRGLFDVFITHLTDETNTLWRQGPRGMFQDRTAAAGLASPRWRGTGFGAVLADFDNDGAPDLAVVNGRVKRMERVGTDPAADTSLDPFWRPYAERNQLFANDGQGRFRDFSSANEPFCGIARVGRGLACGDIDGDGALDLLVTSVAGRARLYKNTAPHRGHWLFVRAIDPALGRDAYGAEVTVEASKRRWLGWVNPGYSYLCS
ncbi:MAG: VCBS repeat-containing protein, partial [Planctomycetota bacterium]